MVCGESKGLNEAEMPCSDTRIVKIYFDFCSTDLMVTLLTGDSVILEAYRHWGEEEFLKSQAYQDRVSSNQFKKGENYGDAQMVAIINIVRGKINSNMILDEYKLVSI